MNARDMQNPRQEKNAAPAPDDRGTVRIAPQRWRFAVQALVGLGVSLFCAATLTLGLLGVIKLDTNPWHWVASGFAAIVGIAGWLRGMARFQDADAGLVIGPRGVTVHSVACGRRGLIPWRSVSSIDSRRYKHHTYVTMRLREKDAEAAESGGWLAVLRRRQAVRINATWLRMAPAELEALLRRYLARYGGA